jgi:putative flippase GtrA
MKKEINKYIIVGIGSVATDFLAYTFLSLIMAVSAAKMISYILGMVVGFIFNRAWTFQHTGKVHTHIVRYGILYAVSLGLNVYTNYTVLYFFPYAITGGFIIATTVSIVTNYIGQKYWVFKK